jgi:glycosyltransferase involved in cell wall biosynthesis
MRILQAMAGAQYGGAERFFERLVPALGELGVEQRVLFRKDERRAALLRQAGLHDLHQLGFGNRLDLVTRLGFRQHVRDFAPDIVFTWMSRATLMAPKSPLAGHRFRRVARLGGYYDLKYYRDCDMLVGDTEAIVHYLAGQGWPTDRAAYLPNFVDATPGQALPRDSLFVPEQAPLLLALGRLHANKGFDLLLEAMSHLPDSYLLLAGAGPERESLEARAVQLGVKPRVRFLGWREDVADLMATADLFVHPARHEPLGNVILEAWAHRRPVVATAADGPRLLIEDGVTGLLAPLDQPVLLAAVIRNALYDRAALGRLAVAGERRHQRDFSKAAVVEQYRNFFNRVAEAA